MSKWTISKFRGHSGTDALGEWHRECDGGLFINLIAEIVSSLASRSFEKTLPYARWYTLDVDTTDTEKESADPFDLGYTSGVVQALALMTMYYEQYDIDVPHGVRDAVLNLLKDE